MNDTFIPNSDYGTKKWYIIDASKKPLGRVSTVVAAVLQGKHKVDYHPSVDMGDYVIVINAETMHLDSWGLSSRRRTARQLTMCSSLRPSCPKPACCRYPTST